MTDIKKSSTFKNFVQRLTLISVACVPIILMFNHEWKEHLVVRSVYLIFMLLLSIEIHYLLPKNMRPNHLALSIIAGMTYPIYVYIQAYAPDILVFNNITITPNLILIILIIYSSIFVVFNKWDNILNEIMAICFFFIYPGLFGSYWLQVAGMESATIHLYALVGVAYNNDGFAYFGGLAFGKFEKKRRTKPLLTVSPKKTIVGFITGYIFGTIMLGIMYAVSPSVWNNSIPKLLLFAFFMNISVVIGDLLESAIKRILNKKDSGTLMLGRGGILDTFDSLLITSPIYYYLYYIIF